MKLRNMRIYINEGGVLVIKLREERAPYYDEYFSYGGWESCRRNNEIAYGKLKATIYPYYSEKGELAEIKILISSFGESGLLSRS